MKVYKNVFEEIISLENLFAAWDTFKSNKQKKRDVQAFEWNLEHNIFELHRALKSGRYRHGSYTSFFIQDPKQRHIHKALVQDRILHHALFTVLNPIFESTFIAHSFSCRVNKGTHKGIEVLEGMIRKITHNGVHMAFALKCDVQKFFGSVDHQTLKSILARKIKDVQALDLCSKIIDSFATNPLGGGRYRRGLPIGNLTSQLFANIYLNEFDQFIKHDLKVKNYVRYTDDFVIVHQSEEELKNLLPKIREFLSTRLKLTLHPRKVILNKTSQGVDFLGYVLLLHHRALRTKTRRRIVRKFKLRMGEYRKGVITRQTLEQSLQSYLGVLSHADNYVISEGLKNMLWFWK
ncbi:MAG: group II intron reverse transcriptase domain-containing protein [Patescibacteria group bacterium]|nr:group II intron reverse transcriptase domain-containing protein [Patescibacteria group bacterium]MDE2438175.1 group II intron reverse transcriptase domain-containing protein [Patescibacteria group bacterium]